MIKSQGAQSLILICGICILAGCQAPYIEVKGVYESPDWDQNLVGDQLYEKGKAAFRDNDMIRALGYFKAALGQDPQAIRTLNGLGSVYDNLQRFDLAQTYYYRALQLDPGSSSTLNNLGYSHLLQKKPRIAVDYFRKAYQLNSSDRYVQNNLRIAEQKLAIQMTQLSQPHAIEDLPGREGDEGKEAVHLLPQPTRSYRVVKITAQHQQLKTVPHKGPGLNLASLKRPVGYQLSLKGQPEIYADQITGPVQTVKVAPTVETAPQPVAILTPVNFAPGDDTLYVARPPVPTAAIRSLPLVEISNGAGRRGMAARLRTYMKTQDIITQRLTNADHYSHMTTHIYYQPGWQNYAQNMAAQLPIPIALEEVPDQMSQVRLEIGGDLLAYDADLIKNYKNL